MRWKSKVREAADRAGKYSGLLAACEHAMRSKITVLMYHRVLEDPDCVGYPFPSIVMPRSLFEAQVRFLARNARVLTVAEALREGPGTLRSEGPVVCLTFDDGYVDNFDIVAPVLEAEGLRGSFYITAGAVEARKRLWYDTAAERWSALGPTRLYGRIADEVGTEAERPGTSDAWVEWLKTLPNQRRERILSVLEADSNEADSTCALMTIEQVRSLAERGHEIGAHSLSHPILTNMEPDERQREIAGSRRLLRRWTGDEVVGFCYPNGDFDAEVIEDVREAGYTYACTTSAGRNSANTDPFSLLRIDVTPKAVASSRGDFDRVGFRAEISLYRNGLRRLSPRSWRSR